MLRVLPTHNKDVPTPQCQVYVKIYVIDVNTSEEGAHSPSWPNGLLIIIT